MQKFLLYLFFLLHLGSIHAQIKNISENLKYYTFNVKLHKGFILSHNPVVSHLADQHPTQFEFDAYKRTDGSKIWHQVHRFPTIGFSFNMVFMDPTKSLGNMASIVAYLSKPIFKTSRSELNLRIGFGPGYASKVFDLQSNSKNIMISSRFNFCLNGRINYSYTIGKHINLNTGIGIIHFSNGTVKLPNQGINIPSIHLGIGFNATQKYVVRKDTIPPVKRTLNLEMMVAFGIKEQYPIQGKKFLATTISTYINKRFNHKSSLMIGLDLFYDPTVERYFNDPNIPFGKKSKCAIAGGHELHFGKLSLLTQIGGYIYDPYKINVAIYERYGLKYRFNKSAFAQLSMKIYFGSVDYVEWGIGYRI